MNFSFDEDQQSLGDTVAQVLADFPALTGPEMSTENDGAAWNALAQIGLFSLLVPEEEGGVGLSLVDLALAVEGLGSGLAPPLVASTLIATEVFTRYAPEGSRKALFGAIAGGQKKIAIAILEPGQDDPLSGHCSLSDGVLTGRKIAVAGALDADLFLVLAQVSGRATPVLVDSSAPGVVRRAHDSLDPSAGLGAVDFQGVSPLQDCVFGEGAAECLLDVAATVEAGIAIGIGASMTDRAVEYAKTRQQFGQPIGAFQTIKHRCADMAVSVEAGRATAYYAFWTCGTKAFDQSQRASSAKAYCSEIARDVCNDSLQIHGGMGFTWELALHRYLRRAKVLLNSLGGSAWHYRRVFEKSLVDVASPDVQRDAA